MKTHTQKKHKNTHPTPPRGDTKKKREKGGGHVPGPSFVEKEANSNETLWERQYFASRIIFFVARRLLRSIKKRQYTSFSGCQTVHSTFETVLTMCAPEKKEKG